MPNVIDQEIVAITPAVHIEMVGRSKVILPERFVEQKVTSIGIADDAKRMFDR